MEEPKKVNNKKRGEKKQQNIDENGVIVIPPPKAVGNKEHFQRLNYLYQLSMFLTLNDNDQENNALTRSYINNMDLISKKTKCNALPKIKRGICKKCKRILIPTKTASIEIRNQTKKVSKKENSKNDDFVIRCKCGEEKIFRVGLNKNYKTFYEKDGNLVDI